MAIRFSRSQFAWFPVAGWVRGRWRRLPAAIALLVPILDERIERAGLRRLLDDVELPLSAVLGEMQALGIRLDVTYLTSMAEEVRGRMEALRRDIVGHAGEEFNLNSPQQLRAILYDKLGLAAGKKTKTGRSTDADTLEKLEHPLPQAVMVDMDGTLVDTLGDFEVALNLTFVDLGLPMATRHAVSLAIGKGSEHLIRTLLGPAKQHLYIRAWDHYQAHYQNINGQHSDVFAGVVEGLERLTQAQCRLACLTNKPLAFAQDLLRVKGLDGFFSQVFGGDSFARKKPDPLPLLKTCEALGVTPAQIRKDLAYFGEFGVRGVGYYVRDLKRHLRQILGLDRRLRVAIIGAGNLGLALADYPGFRQEGFEIVALFDNIREKVGQESRGGVPILDINDLKRLAKRDAIRIAVIAVPAHSAQRVVDLAIASGIKAVLNFSPGTLQVPPDVKLKSVDLTVSLESLSFYLARGEEENPYGA